MFTEAVTDRYETFLCVYFAETDRQAAMLFKLANP
ncbi:UNVERIFIED_ORG: hypothetical protein M2435_006550 [Rhizobium sophorae]|nr:hypothetical protein [Rhizobium leguminosarum]MDH6663604.1 hypothetical protein [Rhizobium sophorae]